jgi:rhodanese-related sulfurtransferase
LILICIGVAGCAGTAGEGGVREITQQALLSDPPENVLILDVRSSREYRAGHVPNALNIPHNELVARLSELESATDRPIVVYCKSGHRAGLATSMLGEAGYTDLHHLTGDMDAWKAQGFPTE